MSFERPELLWLLLLAPLELLLALRRAPRLRASLELLSGPRRRGAQGARYAAASVYGTAASVVLAAASALALAGPAWGVKAVASERSGLEVAVVLDVSRSMEVREGGASRLEGAKSLLRGLLRQAPGASFSLVAAKGDAVLLVPMTEDLEALDSALDYADPETTTAAGTDLGTGIRAGLESFTAGSGAGRAGADRAGVNRALLLLSDGGDKGGEALKAAEEAKKRKTRLLAVGLGGADALPVPGPSGGPLLDAKGDAVRSALEPTLLRAVAAASGGRYLEASDSGAAQALRAELAELGRGGKRVEYESKDRSSFFILLALAALVVRVVASILAFAAADRSTVEAGRAAPGRPAAADSPAAERTGR